VREEPLGTALPLPGDELFRAGKVLEVRLTLASELLRELEEHGDQEKYMSASVRLELQGEPALELGEIGVRYKGDYSLHHCWDESGGVGPTPQPFVIELARLYYPGWAKEDGEEGQGFRGSDSDARLRVLQRFTGLVFGPSASVDAVGELSTMSETGHLRIDNIYFR
jgi:hypothetical protein